nr:bifunctional adenosylcobinamide kinase/adenosylcobinamide-phosphate guanylyltransferase [Propionibacterium sp.]
MRRLIIGGARSGKSHFAESLLAAARVDYVATSQRRPDDPEWAERIAAHVARRPAHWATLETADLEGVLAAASDAAVLVDCLTVWLARVLDEEGCWPDAPGEGWVAPPPRRNPGTPPAEALRARVAGLAAAVASTRREVVLVTNEVGQGVVPASAAGRLFRDELGILNIAVAAACDEVWLVTAGIPTKIKGER